MLRLTVCGSMETILWLTPHAAVTLGGGFFHHYYTVSSWMMITVSHAMLTVKLFRPWLAPPRSYWRFVMLFFDCWLRASATQEFSSSGGVLVMYLSMLPAWRI
jgi:hypothetical protein